MAIEVTCPHCQSVLRAPEDKVGKKARCKRCQKSLIIPGHPSADSVEDTQQLSVVDQNATVHDPSTGHSAGGDPFAFDAAPARTPPAPTPPKATRVPVAQPILPADAPASDPFAFTDAPPAIVPPSTARKGSRAVPPSRAESAPQSQSREPEQAEPVIEEPEPFLPTPDDDNPFAIPADPFAVEAPVAGGSRVSDRSHAKQKSRSSGTTSTSGVQRRSYQKQGGGKGRLLMILLIGLVCAGGGGAGVYFFLQSQNPAEPATGEQAKAPGEGAPAEPGGENPPEATPEDGDPATQAATPSEKKSASSKRPGRTVTVAGGFKLPPFPKGPGEIVAKAKHSYSLEIEPVKVRRVLIASDDAAIAVVVWRSFDGFKGAGATDTVDRFSLNSGQRIDRQEIAADGVAWPRACDLSPSGNLLASETPAGKITLWNLNDKAKVLDGFDPYRGAPAGQAPGIAACYFVDEEKLAVVSTLGDVDTIDIPKKERVVEGTRVDGITAENPLVDQRTVAITPDRKVVLIHAAGTIYEVPVATGKPRASLTLPRNPGAGYALAADASGARVLVAYEATDPGPHTRVVIARLGESKTELDTFLDASAGKPVLAEWTGQETALAVTDQKATALLFDAEVGRIVAAVNPVGSPAAQQPGATTGMHWSVLPDPGNARKSVLMGVVFPHEGYFAMRDANEKEATGLTISPAGIGK